MSFCHLLAFEAQDGMAPCGWQALAWLVSGVRSPGTTGGELPVTSFHVACSRVGCLVLVIFLVFYALIR